MSVIVNDALYKKILIIKQLEEIKQNIHNIKNLNKLFTNIFQLIQKENPIIIYNLLLNKNYLDNLSNETIDNITSLVKKYHKALRKNMLKQKQGLFFIYYCIFNVF